MATLTLADHYKKAGIPVSPEVLEARHAPYLEIKASLENTQKIDLVRLYFGLPVQDGAEWFRAAFAKTDISFSMVDNQKECALLAVSLLIDEWTENKYIFGALVALAASAGGLRSPLVFPEYLEEARQSLAVKSSSIRGDIVENFNVPKLPAKSKHSASIDAAVADPDTSKLAEALKASYAEGLDVTKTLSTHISTTLTPLVQNVGALQEEVSMLWWYVGGWSESFGCPYSELDIGRAALVSGIDLAQLIRDIYIPIAAPALLHRLIFSGREPTADPISIDSIIDEFPDSIYPTLKIPESITKVFDLCPILTAFFKANEIGAQGAWHGVYKKLTGLDAQLKLSPIALAIQAVREYRFLSEIS